jgi:Eco29kI restriction endonuclease
VATRIWNRARPTDAFDPLSLVSLQKALREQLEQSGLERFPPADFRGAGVYALYYIGDMPLYSPLKETECGVPIYVGRAEAGNSSYGEPASLESLSLVDRIKKHSRSVREAGPPLTVADFRVRYLALDDAWIVLAERALLREYRPVVWNTVTPGFGANEPGTDRNNARSIWDTVHPGRARAVQASLAPTPIRVPSPVSEGSRLAVTD